MTSYALPSSHAAILRAFAIMLRARNGSGWLVGGYLRDLLRGQPGSDIDIAVDGPALDLARSFADQTGGSFVTLDDATSTARVVWKSDPAASFVIDVVRLRAPTIERDLQLRDLTINALALPIEQAAHFAESDLLDPTGGLADLRAGLVRPCGPTALTDDPLRMLRAVRFAAQLRFDLAATTDAALRLHAARITGVAAERVRDELLKLLAADHAAPSLAYLDDVRLLTQIIPELDPARDCTQPREHVFPVLRHLLEAVSAWEWARGWGLRAAGRENGGTGDDGPGAGGEESGIEDGGSGEVSALRASPQHPTPYTQLWVPAAVRVHPDLTVHLPNVATIGARMDEPVMAEHRRNAIFKLGLLLHDVGKPATRAVREDGRITFYGHDAVGAELAYAIGGRLRMSRDVRSYLRLIVGEHMRPGQLRALGSGLTRRAIYRLRRDAGAAYPDLLLHALCDHMAASGPRLKRQYWDAHVHWTAMLLEIDNQPERAGTPERWITGTDLIRELGLEPGPLIGRLLAAIDEARFVGDIATREEAIAFARRLAENGAA